jgi:hypothetical protein
MAWLHYNRVEFLLPSNSRREEVAAERAEIDIRDAFGGATVSARQTPVFHGYWFAADHWVRDAVVLVVADTAESPDQIDAKAAELHSRLVRYYEAANSPQDAFWITQQGLRVFSP